MDPPIGNPPPGGGNPPAGAVAITINPGTRFQTIVGWEGTAEMGQVECDQTAYRNYKTEVLDRLVNELGINRVRLQIGSGAENNHDSFADLQAGTITQQQWRATWYQIVNDNADPNTINPAGFQFGFLDNTIDNIVLPLKQRIEAKGEKLYVNLNYVDFGTSAFEHKTAPAEYGEFMLATFQHISAKYHWVPDAIEVVLEPDNQAAWSSGQIAQAIMAAGARLKAAGFTPDFIAPSTINMTRAVSFFDAIIGTPGIRDYLKELSYHRYGITSADLARTIGARAQQYGVRTSMLEHIGSTHEDLHEDLALGRNSAWAQYTLAYCLPTDNGGKYYGIDIRNVNAPQIIMGSRTKMLRQYFYFVRAGAVRIGATSASTSYDPLAFTNKNGSTVVVVKASAAGDFWVQGLPAGRYGIKYTTTSAYNVDAPDVNLASGQGLSASIPAAGVLTIYGR